MIQLDRCYVGFNVSMAVKTTPKQRKKESDASVLRHRSLVIETSNAAMPAQVCEDLVKMINEEARVDPADGNQHDDIFGDDGDYGSADGQGSEKMDYSKPFRLFDEQGLGIIPVDQFRWVSTFVAVAAIDVFHFPPSTSATIVRHHELDFSRMVAFTLCNVTRLYLRKGLLIQKKNSVAEAGGSEGSRRTTVTKHHRSNDLLV